VFWVAPGSEDSIRRAALRGFNMILDQYASPEVLGRRIALYRAERKAAGLHQPARIAVARQAYVASDRADAKAALERQAAWTKRTVDVSRMPGASTGSHVLAYADTPQGTEANALYGTPDEICRMLEALQAAGVEYIILTLLGGAAQLRRFAREIMPSFAA
jgi:alkanesulfonate monooxygenase SsuD/methylene tetrahydromethanopterin reductase-like flavin-dependent oxidoreductase (luciferase family)